MDRPSFIDNRLLKEIRDNADWRKLFSELGLVRDEHRSKINDWWARSPLSDEKTASFHINDDGWYCHSTAQGGGPVELVQKVIERQTGKAINCYEAGRWMLEHNVSLVYSTDSPGAEASTTGGKKERSAARSEKEKSVVMGQNEAVAVKNEPIRQNLIPKLVFEHADLARRQISAETCAYLGCGFLNTAKGTINNRIVFQVRGVVEKAGVLQPVILTHLGRATSWVQEEREGKWHHYANFHKTLELYNIDNLLLDEKAVAQAKETGRVVLVEGCFDVAKCIEAGVYNVAATFGAHLAEDQLPRLKLIADRLGIDTFLVWYDRDVAGTDGQAKAVSLLAETGYKASGFDWERKFSSRQRTVGFPEGVKDACDMRVKQLQWLREKGVI